MVPLVPLIRLIKTILYLASKTRLRLIAVEGAARLSIRGAETIRKEILLYKAYHARRLAPLPQPQLKSQSLSRTLNLCAPRRSNTIPRGVSGTLDSTISEGRFPRWAALVGVTAAQLAVAYKWPLEDSGEAEDVVNAEAAVDGEEKVGMTVKTVEHLDDLLAVKFPEIEPPDLAMEFWEDFGQDLQT